MGFEGIRYGQCIRTVLLSRMKEPPNNARAVPERYGQLYNCFAFLIPRTHDWPNVVACSRKWSRRPIARPNMLPLLCIAICHASGSILSR